MQRKRPSRPALVKRRILIVDDHPLVRRGLTALIGTQPDLTVCAEASTQRAGLEAFASSEPDLVITDLSLRDGDGLALLRGIRARHKDLPVLVLTMHEAAEYARRAFEAGASGYVTKGELTGSLLAAIRCVLDGERFLSPAIRLALDAK